MVLSRVLIFSLTQEVPVESSSPERPDLELRELNFTQEEDEESTGDGYREESTQSGKSSTCPGIRWKGLSATFGVTLDVDAVLFTG